MQVADTRARWALRWFVVLVALQVLPAGVAAMRPRPAAAEQEQPQSAGRSQERGPRPADDGAAGQADKIAQGTRAAEADLAAEEEQSPKEKQKPGAAPQEAGKIRVLELVFKGGPLMWPISAMSLLMVAFGIERLLGLRRRKVLPPELISGLGRLARQKGGLEPRQAYKVCQQHPSAAANVIKAMLLKVGRPHTELEHTVSEANNREAARLYANVRWLSLTAGVTPLLGLLGTVLGMIQAFFATANLPTGANKAQTLAEGIYEALVTTAAGLCVAIPAFVLAHLFEGRIQKLFRELDETLLGLMPQLERFEGRLRVSPEQGEVLAADSPPVARPFGGTS